MGQTNLETSPDSAESKKEKKKHYQDIHYFKTHMGKLCRGLSNLSGCFHELGKIVTSQKPEWEQLSMIMNLRDQHNRPFINQETNLQEQLCCMERRVHLVDF